MAIVIRSGLLAAVQSVRSYFTAKGVTAKVETGWRKRTQQVNQGPGGANRVVFIPSDESGNGGELVSARFPGKRNIRDGSNNLAGDVRSLQDWTRHVTVSVWAIDSTNLHNEEAQIEAAESLFEWTMRAVHSSPGAFAEAKWSGVQWTIPAERSCGLELLAGLTFKHPVYDEPCDLVFPSAIVLDRGEFVEPTSPYETPGDAG